LRNSAMVGKEFSQFFWMWIVSKLGVHLV